MIASALTLVPSGTILARRRTIEGRLRDRCILYDGEMPFRSGVGGEGVRDAWEEDGEVELVGGFYIHVVMKQKFGFFYCNGLYVL
jgi:hypothetical protein